MLISIIFYISLYIFFRILWQIDSSKEHNLLELEIFCNIKNIFTATFELFTVSLLNKIQINELIKKSLLTQPFEW